MLRFIPAVLCALIGLSACTPQNQNRPLPSPEIAALRKLAASPTVPLDRTDAPRPPKGFTRADVNHLARWLIEAVKRTGTADQESIVTERDAVDHTFHAIDMRSRVKFSRHVTETSRDYGGIPLAWIFTDRWESGDRPTAPSRVIKAAWKTERSGDWLMVSLHVIQAFRNSAEDAMFVRREFVVASTNPRGGPAVPVWMTFSAGIDGIDRCHLVATGRFRVDTDTRRLREAATRIQRQLDHTGLDESTDTDFTAGCE